jgi:hypothetical protein
VNWYRSCPWRADVPRGVVQVDHRWQRRPHERPTLPEGILRLAHAEYAKQHHRQSFERIQERGGFGITEVVALLADAAVRAGAPTTEEGS